MYNFIFDRKSLALLLAGLAVAGLLLFAGGVLVGINWAVPYQTRVATLPPPSPPQPHDSSQAQPPPAGASGPAAYPAMPIEEEPAQEPTPATDVTVEDLPLSESEPVPEPEPEPAPLRAPSAPVQPAMALAATQEPSDSPAATAGGYAVQVGAFLREENSEKVARDLESRGYPAYVEPLANERGRLFHTVRVGRYARRDEAARAASELRQREQIAAIVQPAGSL